MRKVCETRGEVRERWFLQTYLRRLSWSVQMCGRVCGFRGQKYVPARYVDKICFTRSRSLWTETFPQVSCFLCIIITLYINSVLTTRVPPFYLVLSRTSSVPYPHFGTPFPTSWFSVAFFFCQLCHLPEPASLTFPPVALRHGSTISFFILCNLYNYRMIIQPH